MTDQQGPRPERRTPSRGWLSKDVLRTAALVIALYVLAQVVWRAHPLVFATFLGVLFGLGLSAGVDQLERLRMPRALGAALIAATLIGSLVGLGAWLAPTLREQGAELRRQLPEAIDRVEVWIEDRPGLLSLVFGRDGQDPPRKRESEAAPTAAVPAVGADTVDPAPPAVADDEVEDLSLRERLADQMHGATRYLFPFISSTVAIVAGLMYVLFVAIYLSVQPDLYRRGVMALVPPRNRERAGEVLTAMGNKLRRWLVTQLVAMVAVGIVTTIALMLLGIPSAVALGIIAGLLEFIPTIGPIIAAIPAVAMGFLESPQQALLVLAAYVVIQQAESQLLTPLLMRGAMDLPPVVTITAQAVMAVIFGFIGLLVAVPMVAAGIVAVQMLYVERYDADGSSHGGDAEDDVDGDDAD